MFQNRLTIFAESNSELSADCMLSTIITFVCVFFVAFHNEDLWLMTFRLSFRSQLFLVRQIYACTSVFFCFFYFSRTLHVISSIKDQEGSLCLWSSGEFIFRLSKFRLVKLLLRRLAQSVFSVWHIFHYHYRMSNFV
jgi:hypothetical protein